MAESYSEHARVPWYLDRDNSDGLTLKDSHGDTVLEVNYDDFPSEWSSDRRNSATSTLQAQARLMVAMSKELTPL